MAVQAQYPSNILLLNRTGQETNEYSLQQPQQGGFIDQSHLLYNNQGINLNTRKRGRDANHIQGIVAANNSPIMNYSPFSIQTQPSPMIDLSQLQNRHYNHHQQPPNSNGSSINMNVVSTGLHLSFNDQHLHNHYQQQQHHNNMSMSSSSSLLLDDFLPQFKRQRDELDTFLHTQGEQLRHTLAEKRQRHYRTLITAAEESAARRFHDKDIEIEKATRRNAELEARAAQLTVEAQVWQAKARAHEATAASLQAQLQHALAAAAGGCATATPENLTEEQVEDAESAYVDPDRVTELRGPSCKECRRGLATVVSLPCRHLCLCTECGLRVEACPVCLCVRNSSVEVYLS
ncbi:hypothetical protein ACFE04_015979 [Oxalis oulophora]